MAKLPNFLVIIRSEKLSGKGQGRGCLGVRKKERFVLGKRTFRSQKSKHFVLRIIKELIILLKNGDEKAFTTLYRLYWSKVYNFSRLYLSSITEVEEVVQEVFVKVWETRDFLRADDNFKGYLFIITRNLIFNQFRKSFNENAYKLTVLSAAMDYYDMEDELSAADLKEFIKRMVGGLPPRQQEVFKMSRDEHLTYKEIATRLNISEKTVERHINEAIKFLKKNIMLYLIFIF